MVDVHFSKVVTWCNANKLTINHLKTNYIVFRTNKRKVALCGSLHINNKEIDEVDETCFVGVILDKNLNWSKHAHKVNSIVRKKVGIIFRLSQFIPQSILLLIYKTFIQPHVTYGLEVWGSTYRSHLTCILTFKK